MRRTIIYTNDPVVLVVPLGSRVGKGETIMVPETVAFTGNSAHLLCAVPPSACLPSTQLPLCVFIAPFSPSTELRPSCEWHNGLGLLPRQPVMCHSWFGGRPYPQAKIGCAMTQLAHQRGPV